MKVLHKVWFQFSIITQDFSITIFFKLFYDFINFYFFCFSVRRVQLTANVSRLENVAKMQHQAITNIHKTLNLATAPFQKFPKLAIFLNRCCRLHNIFGTYKTQRKVFPQSSDCHAKYIFTQSLVSGFHFTTDFPENVFSAQSLSTKFGSVFNFYARFSVIIYSEKVGEKPSA